MNETNNIFIVIPAFNEEKILPEVIAEIKKANYDKIIIVDDGSSDGTYETANKLDAVVVQHSINRGKGAAIKTGMEVAKIMKADIAVTIDGDGQHDPKDIEKMIKLISDGHDVILGVRSNSYKKMPFLKKIANRIGNFLTWFIYGLWVSDSQSGFRAYSKRSLEIIDTKTDRYEYDSEVIREIYKHKLKYTEIPIEVRYTQYSMAKRNKQGFKNGIKTLAKMIISV